jgi:aminopeptidase N
MRVLLLLALVLWSGHPAFAQPRRLVDTFGPGPLAAARDVGLGDVDAIAYGLDLRLADGTPGSERYEGRFEGFFEVHTALGELALDFDESRNVVSEVRLNGRPASFTHAKGKLRIGLSAGHGPLRSALVSVRYEGAFLQLDPTNPPLAQDGLMVEPPTPLHAGRLFFTFNWPSSARKWLPVRDHPADGALFTLRATFPGELQVLGNGNLVKEADNGDGTRTTAWVSLSPMPAYGFFFGAYDDWAELDLGQHSGRALTAHVYSDQAATLAPQFEDTGTSLDFFAERFGPFRWGRLAFVEDPLPFFGGMENPSVVSLSQLALTQFPEFVRELRIHETTHHWCGNLVRLASWNDFWLSEGCANYLTGRFMLHQDPPASARRYWGTQLRRAILNDGHVINPPRHALRPPDPEVPDANALVDGISYEKGAFILRMLEDRLGTERFTQTMRSWFSSHAFGAASTRDFQSAVQSSGGMTPAQVDEFFRQWVYGVGFPALDLSWRHYPSVDRLTISLKQVQPWGPAEGYVLPLELEVTDPDGTRRVPVQVSGRSTTVTIPASVAPLTVVVDPDEVRYLGVTCGEGRPACRAGYTCRVPPPADPPRSSVCVPSL